MAVIKRYEDIESWQLARELTREIYAISNKGEFAPDYGLKDQIRRSSVSVMSNIAEGFERGGNKEFLHFLTTAKASCGECRSQLYVALDAQLITEQEFATLHKRALETSSKIGGFIHYLQQSALRGPKFSH